MAPKTILLKGDPLQKEREAAGTITPGHLIELDTSGNVIVHATSGGDAARMVAIENALQGDEIGDDYSSGDRVQYVTARPGDELYMWLADNETAVIGGFAISNGNGELKVFTGDSADQTGPLFQFLEALDLAATTTLVATRIKVEAV
jgi:hypothetical protein